MAEHAEPDERVKSCAVKGAKIPRRRSRLPASLAPIGGVREEAAAYIGIGVTLFTEMVEDGRMPKPKKINSKEVWDLERVRLAFKALPGDDDGGENEWDEECGSSSRTGRG